jgi:hypothetical protein
MVEWCHASGPKTEHMVLDPKSIPPTPPDTVANPEMFCHLPEASPWGC